MATKDDDELTEHRTLRESVPLWADTPHIRIVASKSASERDYDVIVVGAGISGALVAQSLAKKGRSILVIDRRAPITGSTVASTAMIQHEIDVPLHQLSRLMGRGDAERAWKRSVRAVRDLISRVERLGIVCGMRARKALYLAGDQYGSRALATEAQARNDAGIQAELLSAAELAERFGIHRSAAIVSDDSASANPAQLTAGLPPAARREGVETVGGVEITDVREEGGRVLVATSGGQMLGAQHVVFCTGYEFLEALSQERHSVISTWAVATQPGVEVPPWLPSHLVWEGSDPYLYLRMTHDGRLLIGGEDEKREDAHLSPEKLRGNSATIVEKASALLGIAIPDPEYTWAAAFGTTPSGLPLIDRVPGMKNVYAVMGFGGNGITFSQIAADIISHAIEGSADPDADLFAFSRAF